MRNDSAGPRSKSRILQRHPLSSIFAPQILLLNSTQHTSSPHKSALCCPFNKSKLQVHWQTVQHRSVAVGLGILRLFNRGEVHLSVRRSVFVIFHVRVLSTVSLEEIFELPPAHTSRHVVHVQDEFLGRAVTSAAAAATTSRSALATVLTDLDVPAADISTVKGANGVLSLCRGRVGDESPALGTASVGTELNFTADQVAGLSHDGSKVVARGGPRKIADVDGGIVRINFSCKLLAVVAGSSALFWSPIHSHIHRSPEKVRSVQRINGVLGLFGRGEGDQSKTLGAIVMNLHLAAHQLASGSHELSQLLRSHSPGKIAAKKENYSPF